MADYKGLNIRFRGDTTDASKALHVLSSEARAAQGNLTGIDSALKNTTTNGKALDSALKGLKLDQLGKQAEAARGRVSVLGQSMGELQKSLAGAQQKLAENQSVLASMPEKYGELARVASQAFEQVAAAQQQLAEASQRAEFAPNQQAYVQAVNDQVVAQNQLNAAIAAGDEAFKSRAAQYGTIEGAINSAEESERKYAAAIDETAQKQMVAKSAAQAYEQQHASFAASVAASQTGLGQFGTNAIEAGNNLKKMGDSLTSVGDKLTVVTAIAAMTFGRNVISSTEEFGNAIAQLGGYLDIQGSQLDQMSEQALKWGKDTQFSATEAAQAMNELAKGGMTQAQISGGAMKATMELAAAGQLDMAQAAETSVQAIKAFGLSAEDASMVADALAGAANKSTAEVSDLANGFKYVGGWASMAGWNINDVSGALALLSDHGLQGEMAGTALRNVMQRLAAPTNTAAKLMNAYGFSVRDSTGQMVSATEVVKRLKDTFGQLGDAEKQNVLNDIFGARALPAAVALMDEGAEKLQGYIDATTQAGYASEMAKTRMGDLGWALEYLRGEAETAAVNFGQALTPMITGVAKAIEDAMEWFNGLSEAERENIAQMAVMAAAAGPVISVVGHLANGMGGLFVSLGTGAKNLATFAQAMSTTGSVAASLEATSAGLSTTLATGLAGVGVVAAVAAIGVFAAGVAEMQERLKTAETATRGLEDAMGRLGQAYGEYEGAANGAITTTGELEEKTRELTEEQAKLADDMGDAWGDLGGQEAALDAYASDIERLADSAKLSESDMATLADSVGKFSEMTGTSVDVIDRQTGALNLSKRQIAEVAEAWKRQQEISLASDDREKLIAKQTEAERALADATNVSTYALRNNAVAGGYFAGAANSASAAATSSGQSIEQLRRNYESATKALEDANATIAKGEYRFGDLETAVYAAGISGERYRSLTEEQLAELRAAFDGTISSIQATLQKFGMSVGGVGAGMVEGAQDATADYGDALAGGIYTAAQDAVKAQKKANDAIVREQKRAFDAEYKELQRALDAEYKARQKAYDADYKAQQKAFDAEYKALQKALDKEYKARQKAFDQAYKQRQKELDGQYDAYKKQLDAEESALKKSLDAKVDARKAALDSELAAIKKANDQRLKAQKKADEAETKAFKAETDKRVAALQAEYKERLKALELQYGGSGIDSQIKSLKDQTKAEQAEIKRREQEEKKAELQKAVDQAKTRRSRTDAEKKLNDYLAEIAQEQRESERETQIERLEEQKSALKDELDLKKEALKAEYDARIEALKESRAAEQEVMKEANDAEYEALKEQLDGIYNARKEANDAKIEQQKEANQLEIDNLKEHHSLLLESMKEQHTLQLEQLKEQQAEQLEAIKEDQQAQLDGLKEGQQAQLDAMKEAQQADLDSMKEGHQAQLEELKQSQQDQLQALKDGLDSQVGAVDAAASQMVNTADAKSKEATKKLDEGTKPMPENTKNTAKLTLRNYLDVINQMPWETKKKADTTGHSLVERLNAHVMPTSDAAQALRNAALRNINGLPNDYKQKGEESGGNLAAELDAKSGVVGTSASNVAGAAKNPFDPLPGIIGGKGSSAASNFARGISDNEWRATDSAHNVASGVADHLSSPANSSEMWGSHLMGNLNNGIVSYWNDTLLPNLQNIAQSIANLLAHSTPKEGPLKGDDMWFYHLGQNLDSGLRRSVPALMGTVEGIARGVEEGMDPDVEPVDLNDAFEDSMARLEDQSSVAARAMADAFSEAFSGIEDGMRKTMAEMGDMLRAESMELRETVVEMTAHVQVDTRRLAEELHVGVTEALRSGVPQQQGVTVVVQNMQVRNESDIRRVSEGLYTLAANASRRGW